MNPPPLSLNGYRVQVLAPGLPNGHTFHLPAEAVPVDPRRPVAEVLDAVAGHVTDRLLHLRVSPAALPAARAVGGAPRRHEQRLRRALADYLGVERDAARHARASALLEKLKDQGHATKPAPDGSR